MTPGAKLLVAILVPCAVIVLALAVVVAAQ